MNDPERLARLEERFAWLERHVVEQDKAMLELGDELTRLRRETAGLRSRLRDSGEEGGAVGEEKPPHY